MSDATTATGGGEGAAPSTPAATPTAPTNAKSAAGNAAPPAATPTAAPAPRRHKITANGREEEVDDATYIDRLKELHGEDGIRNIANLGAITRRKLSELGHSKKQIDEALEDLSDMERLGALIERKHGREKALRWMEGYYSKHLEQQKLDPAERERRAKLDDIEERERKLKERERGHKATEVERQAAALQPKLEEKFTQAVKAHGVERLTPVMRSRMAKLVEDGYADLQRSGERITGAAMDMVIADAAREVASRHYDEVAGDFPRLPEGKRAEVVRSVLASMTPAQIYAAIGEQRMREFRRWDLDEAKRRRGGAAVKPLAPQPKPNGNGAPSTRTPKTIDDWLGPEKF